MTLKSSGKLLALSSAALLCVTSYTVAGAQNRSTAAPTATTSTAHTKAAHHVTPKKKTIAKKKPLPKKKPAVTKKPVAKKQIYKDGTYTGVGQTQIGAVQVAVTMKKDKITDVQITGYTTHYPISYINPVLPQELLQRQDPKKIDVISGATLSTIDFYYAVTDAMGQAKKANHA